MTEEISSLVKQVQGTHIYRNINNYCDYDDMCASESEIEEFISLVTQLLQRYFWCILKENRALAMGHYTVMWHELCVWMSILRHRGEWMSAVGINLRCLMSFIETGIMPTYYRCGGLVNPS